MRKNADFQNSTVFYYAKRKGLISFTGYENIKRELPDLFKEYTEIKRGFYFKNSTLENFTDAKKAIHVRLQSYMKQGCMFILD